ncbi:transcription termination/antitermination protein NusG [Roseovarius sp. TE539]|uniref:transcription termination/antitermination protein NusG n=1 Tax=Roseovarius sp. TE539 TaxID=2249812 RepID=UPI0011BE0B15|nr:transcription termination/antitermination NusG family protein [Roseovarius sp. TE539]
MISLRSSQFIPSEWHLLLCKPNRNHIAMRNLNRLRLDLFMPQHVTERRWRGRVRPETRPIFAGYIFFSNSDNGARWDRIQNAPGVARIIGFGGAGPARVPTDLVAGLMQRCDESGLLRPEQGFSVGDEIRIAAGPFRDFISTIEHIDAEKRIHVLLDMLGRKTRVTLTPDQVRPKL